MLLKLPVLTTRESKSLVASFSGFRFKNAKIRRLLLSFQFDINSFFQLKDFEQVFIQKFKFKYVHKFPKYDQVASSEFEDEDKKKPGTLKREILDT